jgi:D-glycero-alpha-D-manno-heptose-7-phosphate kinase
MKALILCGGLGTRLRNVVNNIPKAMAPIGGKPFLMHQINWLKKYKITEIILAVGHLKEHIKNYFGDGSLFDVEITYSEEKKLLGTGGAIKLAEKWINDTFIVLNGDTYAKIDFDLLLKSHKENKQNNAICTIGLTSVSDASRYGLVILGENNKVTAFNEKSSSKSGYINGGVYVFEKDFLNYIPANTTISLENEIIPKLVDTFVYGHVWEGTFIDMGVPESYKQLQNEVLKSLFVNKDSSIKDVLVELDKGAMGIALVVDENEKMQGLVTDGDIRRYIIKDDDLNKPISSIMVKNPVTARVGWDKEKIKALVNPRIKHIPILDDNGIIKDVIISADLQGSQFENVVIRAKSPLRISFAGGGTDIWYYFKNFGGCVLNSTIDKYCRGTLIKRNDEVITINSHDFDISEKINALDELNYEGELKLIKAVIKLMKPEFGFDLHLHSDVPPGTGLGLSATAAATVAALLNSLRENKYDDYKLSEIIYKAEREELNIAGGWQDQYATVFGGFNFMEFNREDIIVHPLRINEEIIEELNNNLFLCYTGSTRLSGMIQANLSKKQDTNNPEKSDEVLLALKRLKDITIKMRSALLKGKIQEFGKFLHEGWENKKRLDPRISNGIINNLYDIAMKNGALGGKVLGAGGGGYLLFFCSPIKKKNVTKALVKAGGKILNFNFEKKGLVSWEVKK